MKAAVAPRALLFPVLLSALALAYTLHTIDDFDIWYHLTAGRLMWTTWRWPRANTLAFTTPDHPWIDLHWIFQLLLYGAHALAGPSGCIVLAALLVLITACWLYAGARRAATPSALAAGLVAIALTIASPRFEPRPELLSFVLLAAYVWLLDDYPRCGRAVFLLVPLQLVWANSQGLFAIGISLIGCYWLGATLAFMPLPRGWREESALTPEQWRRLTLVLLLAVAVCFVNPYGIAGALFPLELLPRVTGASIFARRIGEFRPPLRAGYALPLAYTWMALLAATALSFLVNRRRWHLGRLLASAAFGWLSTQALRNVALFAWIAIPAIAGNVGAVLARRRAGPPRATPRAARAGEIAVAVGILALAAAAASNGFSRLLGIKEEFGLGVSRLTAPIDAVEFLRANGIDGRPFNCLVTGSYLGWKTFPAGRVFVDGRLEAYPEDFFAIYFRTLDDPGSWPPVADRYHLDYALLYHQWANRMPLVQYLRSGHGWTLVYYDEITALFLPLDEQHRAVRERAERAFGEVRARRMATTPPATSPWSVLAWPVAEIRRQTGYGEFLQAIGEQAEAARAFERALALDPEVSETRFKLGAARWFSGERERAIAEWRDVLRRDPTFERARSALAEVGASVAAP